MIASPNRTRRLPITALLLGLPMLLAAAPSPKLPEASAAQLIERDLRRTVLSLITAVRIAEGCRIRLAEPARRRADELEAALLALPALKGLRADHASALGANPASALRATRDGAADAGRAWCSVQRADVEEVEEMLVSPEGEDLLRRLRALRDETRG